VEYNTFDITLYKKTAVFRGCDTITDGAQNESVARVEVWRPTATARQLLEQKA